MAEIPGNPRGSGHLSIALDLSKPELDVTIAKLKAALSNLQAEFQPEVPRYESYAQDSHAV